MNREIAKQLGLSEGTIKNYVLHIFDKLGVSSRVELALHATAHKLNTTPENSSLDQLEQAGSLSMKREYGRSGGKFFS